MTADVREESGRVLVEVTQADPPYLLIEAPSGQITPDKLIMSVLVCSRYSLLVQWFTIDEDGMGLLLFFSALFCGYKEVKISYLVEIREYEIFKLQLTKFEVAPMQKKCKIN